MAQGTTSNRTLARVPSSTLRENQVDSHSSPLGYDELLCLDARFEGRILFDQGVICGYNRAVEQLLGHSAESLIKRPVFDLFAPGDRDLVVNLFDKGHREPFEAALMEASGTSVVCEVRMFEHDIEGYPVGVISLIDVSYRRQIQIGLRQASSRATELDSQLQNKDTTLKEILWQVEDSRKESALEIATNMKRIALPILQLMKRVENPTQRQYANLLESCLVDFASPMVARLEAEHAELSTRELEICHMVRNGFGSKEIGAAFSTSVQTVLTQRKKIRKKLGLTNRSVNLVTYLRGLETRIPKS